MNYYEEIPESLKEQFRRFDKEYNLYWALKEKIIAVINSKDEKFITDYVKCDLIIKLVKDYESSSSSMAECRLDKAKMKGSNPSSSI